MAGGSLDLQSSNISDTIEKDDESSKTDFVDAREDPIGNIPSNYSRTKGRLVQKYGYNTPVPTVLLTTL